jgi:hypothetical protein
MKIRKAVNFTVENNSQFRTHFLHSVQKLNDNHSLKQGYEDLVELINCFTTEDQEKLNIAISILSENCDHLKATAKKELLRLFGHIAEISSSPEVLVRIS